MNDHTTAFVLGPTSVILLREFEGIGTLECGTIVASDRFGQPGAFSYRSGQDCRPENR